MSFDVKSGLERAVGLRARDDERLMKAVVERFWEEVVEQGDLILSKEAKPQGKNVYAKTVVAK